MMISAALRSCVITAIFAAAGVPALAAELPALPAFVKIYPGSDVSKVTAGADGSTNITFSAHTTPEQIVAFYAKLEGDVQLKPITPVKKDSGLLIFSDGPAGKRFLTVAIAGRDGGSLVVLGYKTAP